ncbi:MAG: hypothetical protein U0L88_03010, partial [Acutalibacteraceae bacterium]|nr:hypothetical protein [Acutalibacteraceae bacterium]
RKTPYKRKPPEKRFRGARGWYWREWSTVREFLILGERHSRQYHPRALENRKKRFSLIRCFSAAHVSGKTKIFFEHTTVKNNKG